MSYSSSGVSSLFSPLPAPGPAPAAAGLAGVAAGVGSVVSFFPDDFELLVPFEEFALEGAVSFAASFFLISTSYFLAGSAT